MLPDMPRPIPVADVKVGERLEALYVTGRDVRDGMDVFAAIRGATDGTSGVRRTASGVVVPLLAIEHLADIKELDLRWSADAVRFVENRRSARTAYPRLVARLAELKADGLTTARALICDSNGLDVLDGAPDTQRRCDDDAQRLRTLRL